jgi:hypothetical protein
MTALICPECRHENEEQRIYCHDCGTRLDRSSVVKQKIETDETAVETQRRLQRMLDPKRGRAKRLIGKCFQLVLGALFCAAVIAMLLPGELPPASKNYEFAPMIGMDLVSATSDPAAPPLVYSQQQVNSYLASLLRRKGTPGTTGWMGLQRIFVEFDEGICRVTVERKIFGSFSISSSTSYRVRLEARKIIAEPTSAMIGHMPIHPALLKAGNPLLQSAWTALTRERSSVARLTAIEFHPESVRLIPH